SPMLLHPEKQARGAERPSSYLQIPGVVGSVSTDAGVVASEGRFNLVEPLRGRLPALAPLGERPRTGPREARRPTASPGCEAALDPPGKTRERLKKVEVRRHRPAFEPLSTRSGHASERGRRCAESGQDQRGDDREPEQWNRQPERGPE